MATLTAGQTPTAEAITDYLGNVSSPDLLASCTSEAVAIVAAVEAGAGTCRMPWHHDGNATSRPVNLASGKPYRGINVLALWAAADRGGVTQGLWGTYRQWLAVGGQVRKGEHGAIVVLWKQTGADQSDGEGGDDDGGREG